MSFKWKSFYRLANDLTAVQKINDIQEAYFRAAVSRSYYAAFCCARDLLSEKGVSLPNKNIHEFVRNHYQQSDNREWMVIGTNLQRLYNNRIHADYKSTPTLDVTKATISNSWASTILNLLERQGQVQQ